MNFGLDNFLTGIKAIVTGGGRHSNGEPYADGGFLVTKALNPVSDLRTVDGLTLTAATAPAVLRTETNGLTVAVAASATAGGSFMFQVPRDYDEATDHLKIRVMAGMDGETDTPTLTATVYKKVAGSALTADLAPTASSALGESTAWKVIDVSGKGLKRDDVLTINLVTGAHTTNAVSIHGVEVEYRSTLVSYDWLDDSGNYLR